MKHKFDMFLHGAQRRSGLPEEKVLNQSVIASFGPKMIINFENKMELLTHKMMNDTESISADLSPKLYHSTDLR